MKRNLSIDLVKVVAMFMVMTLHLGVSGVSLDKITIAGVYISAIAIPLFFMVSGWLIIDKQERGRWYLYPVKKITGIIRFVVAISLIYVIFESLIYSNWDLKKIGEAIINPFIQKGVFSVFWYLGAMVFVYTLFPAIKKLDQKFGTTGLLAIGFGLFVIETFVFSLNILYNFEEKYVIQTFRIWNWMFYFVAGAIVRRKIDKEVKISGIWALLLAVVYVLYGAMVCRYVHTWEYLYSSPMCMLYSIMTFVFIVNLNITNNICAKLVEFFSKLFLPVYALHIIVLLNLRKMPDLGLGILKPEIYLLTVWIITIGVSWTIMKIPGANKIFRI